MFFYKAATSPSSCDVCHSIYFSTITFAGDTSANRDIKKSVYQLYSTARNGAVTKIEHLPSLGIPVNW